MPFRLPMTTGLSVSDSLLVLAVVVAGTTGAGSDLTGVILEDCISVAAAVELRECCC